MVPAATTTIEDFAKLSSTITQAVFDTPVVVPRADISVLGHDSAILGMACTMYVVLGQIRG